MICLVESVFPFHLLYFAPTVPNPSLPVQAFFPSQLLVHHFQRLKLAEELGKLGCLLSPPDTKHVYMREKSYCLFFLSSSRTTGITTYSHLS